MRRLLALVLALAAGGGCAVLDSGPEGLRLVCRSDSECAEGQVCFADGCGNPGQNIVVEVRPNPQEGLHEQDFPVDNLRPRQNLELFGPAVLQGQVRRLTSEPLAPEVSVAYSSPISVQVRGESLLIPGQGRHYEGTLTPTNGTWRFPVGTGDYTVTLLATDPDVPPLAQARTVLPGSEVALDFLLPATTTLLRLPGRLVRQGTVLVDADMEVQALDESLRPLSQRVPVSRATGDFVLTLPPTASRLSNALIQVTRAPRSEAPVPQKTFSVDPRVGLASALELGDYGEPVAVSGRVLDSAGKPVAGASVYVTGKVGGGGTFRGTSATTDVEGRYALRSLPSHPDTPMTLYVVPPAEALAGLTRQSTVVPRTGAVLADVRCPDKVELRGELLRPEGSEPAAGVRVRAEPVGAVSGWPQPASGKEGLTDASGHFALRLDPGEYRFDFSPVENLPRVSRFVTVRPADNTQLAPFTLHKGSSITGQVTMRATPEERPRAVALARIRFFRVVNVEGRPTAVLLAQTTSDSTGAYVATLPTR